MKSSKTPFNAKKLVNTPVDVTKSLEPAKFAEIGGVSRPPLKPGEHESIILSEHATVKIIIDGKTYTLPELIDAYWDMRFERDALAKEIERSMTALIRIYGQPPFEDCSLSEYLEIVADGQLDEVRAEFEELEHGDTE